MRTLVERCYSIVTEEDDRKKEEEHVAKALSKCGYPPWTIDRVKQDIVEKSLKDEAKKAKNKCVSKTHISPYAQLSLSPGVLSTGR